VKIKKSGQRKGVILGKEKNGILKKKGADPIIKNILFLQKVEIKKKKSNYIKGGGLKKSGGPCRGSIVISKKKR